MKELRHATRLGVVRARDTPNLIKARGTLWLAAGVHVPRPSHSNNILQFHDTPRREESYLHVDHYNVASLVCRVSSEWFPAENIHGIPSTILQSPSSLVRC